MEYLLSGTNIMKSFGSGDECQTVLNNVSLNVREGEFVAIMGSSGSGKSTLLYSLSGMDRIDSGKVLFDLKILSTLSDNALSDLRRQKMGFVFQQPTLLKNMNILENILFPQLRDHRKNAKELTQKAYHLMEQVGIAKLAKRDITQVSGGQLQRAGICRALMNDPKLLFADEPTGALNSKSSDEIMTILSEINKRGTTLLLVTHDAKVAARAERVIFMQDGTIINQVAFHGTCNQDLHQRTQQILSQTKQLDI